MTSRIPESHPLRRLFQGLTEQTFQAELGIADPRIVDYVAELLTRFVPSDAVWRLRDGQGRRITELGGMVSEAMTAESDERKRECLQHVGDFTLFWTGVFPESVGKPGLGLGAGLRDLQQQGKRSYFLASTYTNEQAPLLRRLAAEFELCAFGLSRVRRDWERLHEQPPAGSSPMLLA